MPGSTIAKHNGVTMTFNEDAHTYIDDRCRSYTSVTTLIGKAFEQFDAEKVAKAKALKDGGDWHDYVEKWKHMGKTAALDGTRLHENCENMIRGNLEKIHSPLTAAEKINFDVAEKYVKSLLSDSENIKLEPEKMIFSPKLMISGTVDLLCYRNDNTYIIYDWKNIKKMAMEGFNGKCGILESTKDIQDSNYWHYALQLQLYELILKVEGYIPKNSSVKRILNTFVDGKMIQYDLPNLMHNAIELAKWNRQVVI